MSISDHAPYTRVVSGQTTAVDRQWLSMLWETFDGISAETFVDAGMKSDVATRLLGLAALDIRINDDQPEKP